MKPLDEKARKSEGGSMSAHYQTNASIEASSFANQCENNATQLKKRHREIMQQIKAKDNEHSNNIHANPDKVKRQADVGTSNNIQKHHTIKPLFNWQSTKNDEADTTFEIIPTEKSNDFNSILESQYNSNHLLSLFGYKIDITNQVDQLQKKLQKFFIESKSHNELVGKFSELKFGIMLSILSLLGVKPDTIETLKKDALKKAIQDNINCFEQNEYNFELITIFSTTKKDTARKMVLEKLRRQLIKQMANYHDENFYTKEMIYSIKDNQVKKILGDLLEEKQNLLFQRNYR